MRTSTDHPSDVMRPFMWIAAMAFATGFLGYLGLHNLALF
jgi:hypothetical protein